SRTLTLVPFLRRLAACGENLPSSRRACHPGHGDSPVATPSLPPPTDAPALPEEQHPDGPPFPVVGVGASAGGLEAFTELLEGLSADPGLAILFVAHLDPHHKSLMP